MIQVEIKFALFLDDHKVCITEDWVLDSFKQMDVLLSEHQTLRERVFDEVEQTRYEKLAINSKLKEVNQSLNKLKKENL